MCAQDVAAHAQPVLGSGVLHAWPAEGGEAVAPDGGFLALVATRSELLAFGDVCGWVAAINGAALVSTSAAAVMEAALKSNPKGYQAMRLHKSPKGKKRRKGAREFNTIQAALHNCRCGVELRKIEDVQVALELDSTGVYILLVGTHFVVRHLGMILDAANQRAMPFNAATLFKCGSGQGVVTRAAMLVEQQHKQRSARYILS